MNTRAERAAGARGYSIAIVGMDIWTGPCSGLDSFERSLYAGSALFNTQVPAETNGRRPSEMRLRQAVEGALADAGQNNGGPLGIVIVSEERLAVGGVPVRRARPLAAISACSGPIEDIEADAFAAFERAAEMLQEPQLQGVVIGWINQEFQSAAAVVLMRTADARAADQRVYAVIEEVNPLLEKPEPRDAGLLITGGNISNGAANLLLSAYHRPGNSMTCALGGAAGLPLIPAMIEAALCLYHQFLPASPLIPGLYGKEQLADSPFYLIEAARTWFRPNADGVRRAIVSIGNDQILLSEALNPNLRSNQDIQRSDLRLYPIAGDSLEELLNGLSTLHRSLLVCEDLHQEALKTFETYQQQQDAAYAVVIMGRGRGETLKEIEYALKGVAGAFEKGTDWQTPLGSTFAPVPAGREGSVAFVYPGAFNSYVGMGKDVFRLFPHLHQRFGEVSSDIGSVICEELVYPRSHAPLTEEERAVFDARLSEDPIAMLKSGTTLSSLYTMILRDVFNIEPDAAFGYSLGENSMMFSMGVWTNGDEASQRLSESELFHSRLSGSQDAVREYWGAGELDHRPLWRNYLVMAAPERVYAAMRGEPRVYLTHINTPRQVVIGGDPESCQRVIQSLHSAHLQAPFNHALHNEAMRSEMDALIDLHRSPVVTIPKAKLYSAADYQPLDIEEQAVAHKIGHMLCTHLDFPRLVEQVYASGARIFVELGAGSNCSKWVDECLQGKTHASIGINRRGVDDLTSIVRVLAKLCAHRTKVDLSPLFYGSERSLIEDRMKIPINSAARYSL
jgi:PfaB family protein